MLSGLLFAFLARFAAPAGSSATGMTFFERHTADTEDLTFENCTFINVGALSTSGGAIYIQSGTLTVNYCNFIQCKGGSGGAVYTHLGRTSIAGTTFTQCFIYDSSSGEGVCIYATSGSLHVSNTTVIPFAGTQPKTEINTGSCSAVTLSGLRYDAGGNGANSVAYVSAEQFAAENVNVTRVVFGGAYGAFFVYDTPSSFSFCNFEYLTGSSGVAITTRMEFPLELKNVSFVYNTGSSLNFESPVQLTAVYCCFSRSASEEVTGLEDPDSVFERGTFGEGVCFRGRQLSLGELWQSGHTAALAVFCFVCALVTFILIGIHVWCATGTCCKLACCDNEVDQAMERRLNQDSDDKPGP